MEGCFMFQWWGGVLFQMGGFIFKWGASVLVGGFSEKIIRWGWAPPFPHVPPLWETLVCVCVCVCACMCVCVFVFVCVCGLLGKIA